MNTAVVFANGRSSVSASDLPEHYDLLVAADGGVLQCLRLGLKVDVLIGDLDSTPNELVQLVERSGAEIIRYPVDKDKTDLELALDLVGDRGVREVIILGALGGRLDHAVANLSLPANASYADMRIEERGTSFQAELDATEGISYKALTVRDHVNIQGKPGDIVTLVPVGFAATGISTDGLEFPLTDETLELGTTRGVSNVLSGQTASVSVGSGTLLVIHVSESESDPRVE
jgi:thiamine pyrophosphokinase